MTKKGQENNELKLPPLSAIRQIEQLNQVLKKVNDPEKRKKIQKNFENNEKQLFGFEMKLSNPYGVTTYFSHEKHPRFERNKGVKGSSSEKPWGGIKKPQGRRPRSPRG